MIHERGIPPETPDPYRELREKAGDDIAYYHRLLAVEKARERLEGGRGALTDDEFLDARGHLEAMKVALVEYETSKGYLPPVPSEET